ncbi:MAG: hypothetical protein ABJA67_14485 [Chthonomonadales bacterium]
MVEIELPYPESVEFVEACFENLELQISMRAELKTFPGSMHWHLKKPRQTGKLEVTLWPRENRLWISYHDNRVGDGWVVQTARELTGQLSEF